jgi:hypothetical protein
MATPYFSYAYVKMFVFTFCETFLVLQTSYRESITSLDPQMVIRGSKHDLGNKRQS